MNLMIVEDEPRLRNALAYNIPWEEYGLEVVGLAANGTEALQLAERKLPDLMLVDVQMPEMDGLTLIRHLKKRLAGQQFHKFIILSGHDNFSFAQQAMEQGVFRYLLKPAGEAEILGTVLEAKEQLLEELERWNSAAELQQKWMEHLPVLQNAFILNWAGGRLSETEIMHRSSELQLPVKKDMLTAAAVVALDPLPEGEGRFGPGDHELLQFTLHCLARELLSESSCWVCSDPDIGVLLVFRTEAGSNSKEFMLHINASVMKLLSRIKEMIKLTASGGICGGPGGIGQLPRLYAEARRALQERIVYGQDILIPYREAEAEVLPDITEHQQLEKALEIALETADEHKAADALKALWNSFLSRAETAEQFQEAVQYISSILVRLIAKQGFSVREVAGDDWLFFQNQLQLTTRTQTLAWLERTVHRTISYRNSRRKTGSHQIVQQIVEMIGQEMDQEITLHMAADRMYINSSYLSRLFKQEMGVAFSAYVLEQKMERAKRALQEGHKVYDAARLTGYRDVSYFTKVFRKFWGVNPGEFKV